MGQKFTVVNGQGKQDDSSTIIDLNVVREQKNQEKKRRAERVFFRNIMNVSSRRNDSSQIQIEMIDVSEEGCAFQISPDLASSWPNRSDEIPVRFYFSSDFYFEIQVQIVNANHSIDGKKKMMRFGCQVSQDQKSYPAYQQFVRFLKAYAEYSNEEPNNRKGASI